MVKKYWERLKSRWDIESDKQVAIILVAFTLTGFSTLYIHYLVDQFLGIEKDSPFIYKALVFIVIVLPVYNILLMVYGSLLGQYKFFRGFIIKFFSRIFFIKGKK
ncbi:MAG: prolipoprotein diacylglyceryl transferase [Bacteroidetes bacterium]|nr:MAG: prolipoprotein diacylglyceryl transferase [Bacteroidota bacterium]